MDPATLTAAGNGVVGASSVMIESLKALYGTARSINDYLSDQIEELKGHDNPTIARTGDILEKAKIGFGVGFGSATAVIAVGQLILGNPLAAATAIVTAPCNPVAMTCAAVGAVYYGWSVLSDKEKEEIISRVCHGLQLGVEVVKSVIVFIIQKAKEVWNSEHLAEVKKFIGSTAVAFGKTLGDVTNKITDKIVDTYEKTKVVTGKVVEKTGGTISETIGGLRTRLTAKEKDSAIEIPSVTVQATRSVKVKINSKGQITIPSALRQEIGLSAHSDVELIVAGDNITISKAASSEPA